MFERETCERTRRRENIPFMESGKDPSPYATTKSSLPAAARNRAAALLVKLASNACFRCCRTKPGKIEDFPRRLPKPREPSRCLRSSKERLLLDHSPAPLARFF